jgi:phytoene/squalene synthetase
MLPPCTTLLYDQVCLEASRLTTHRYSTSFSLGIRSLDKPFRDSIYALYGFVRFADEIVDSFHGHNQLELLNRFEADTWAAISEGVSLNPVLHSFQRVINHFNIDHQLVRQFLHSMRLDLSPQEYNQALYEEYILGSAEVVGLMCLKVFCKGDQDEYNKLTPPAMRLGSAFQKINFLRDLKADRKDLGRTYFPQLSSQNFNEATKKAIEADIQLDFDAGYLGILALPKGCRLGVYVAYVYYLDLFQKIQQIPAQHIENERVRISDRKKIGLLLKCFFKHKFNFI